MTDKQVYEALVEHARDQKISLTSIFCHLKVFIPNVMKKSIQLTKLVKKKMTIQL